MIESYSFFLGFTVGFLAPFYLGLFVWKVLQISKSSKEGEA